MATTVKTLKDSGKTNDILPRTQINAIFDTDGNYLSGDLKASDLNPLKDGALDKVPICEDGVPGTPIPIDADTLEGHGASYFATAEALSSLNSTVSNLDNLKIEEGPATNLSLNDIGSYLASNTDTLTPVKNRFYNYLVLFPSSPSGYVQIQISSRQTGVSCGFAYSMDYVILYYFTVSGGACYLRQVATA